ncbi:hypothetical protein RHSIM_Rhsim02G0255200 [Rhododendron simsii]|uniref:Uncharacterized protein n=1 Tax=Rhododendron simsii TaxID=118357 RepID=A0A834HAS7_RHOSS|nr:hypothetical protein RHSIM_Rhsim02G0255200 [Rhododendron simsii]
MVSSLINRLAQLQHNPDHVQKQQPAGSSHLHQQLAHEDDDENHGVRIVTLGGSNTGAAMRGELDDNNARAHGHHALGHGELLSQNDHEEDGLGTYVNSNFQAINNSIMLGGSYSANDPGVHLDISDFLQLPHHTPHAGTSKHKRKEKETSRSDHQHSEPSSD